MPISPPSKLRQSALAPLPTSDYFQAYLESGSFFTDISSQNWKKLKQKHKRTPEHLTKEMIYYGNGTLNGQAVKDPRVWYTLNWDPSFTCPFEERVGGSGDGPKW